MSQSEKEALALSKKYRWDTIELRHALGSIGAVYGPECVVKLRNGKELRTPAYPEECDYVRFVQDGYELVYWSQTEWQEQPAEVMGAIVGAIAGCMKEGT